MNATAKSRYTARCKRCACAMSTLADTNLHASGADLGALVPGDCYSVAGGDFGLPCHKCGALRTAKRVLGRYSAKHVCNAKCLSSTGHDCECSCGGKNHGAAHTTP